MKAKPDLDPNRLEVMADIDIDGAVFEVGVQHYAFGPPGAGIRFNTGAVEVFIRAHSTDVSEMIAALTEVEAMLEKLEKKRLARLAKPKRKARA